MMPCRWGIRNILSEGVSETLGSAFTRDVTVFVGSAVGVGNYKYRWIPCLLPERSLFGFGN